MITFKRFLNEAIKLRGFGENNQTLLNFIDDISNIHPAVRIKATPMNGAVHISDIQSSKPGAGTDALKKITDHADRRGVPLTLFPHAYQDSSMQGKLEGWYQRFGFEPDTNRPDMFRRTPVFYNAHGSHSSTRTPKESGAFYNQHGSHSRITEQVQSDIYEEMLSHPRNEQRAETLPRNVEVAFKDFATPVEEHTETAYQHAQKTGDYEQDFSHFTSRGINHALIHNGTKGTSGIPDMDYMDAGQHKEALARADIISKEISRAAPLHRDATVYHGTILDPTNHLDSNGILHSHGFLSTSSHRSIAEEFTDPNVIQRHKKYKVAGKHVLSISVPKGHKILPVSDYHSNLAYESEMLLDRGTKLKHIKSEQDGKYTIHHFEVHND